jgi:hypothetical protein
MSESMGGIISECPGDFIGIGMLGYNLTRVMNIVEVKPLLAAMRA